jgi:hypothetical protein
MSLVKIEVFCRTENRRFKILWFSLSSIQNPKSEIQNLKLYGVGR